MHWHYRKSERQRVLRAVLALFLAINHAVIAVGLPIPQPSRAAESTAEIFPCMDCPCGCRTAEHCWRNCCCYTMTQKLAWAKAHGVEPPDFVKTAAEREKAAGKKGCCPHCHAKEAEPVAQSHETPRQQKPRGVLLWMDMQCQGMGLAGILSGLPAVMPSPPAYAVVPAPLYGTVALPSLTSDRIYLSVPVPPPRRSV